MEYQWNISDLISYYSTQAQSTNSIWNFYGVVILGILAFIAASPQSFSKRKVRLLLLAGFILFAVSNFFILQLVHTHLYSASKELAEVSKGVTFKTQEFSDAIQRVSKMQLEVLGYIHIIGDIITALVIWFVPRQLQ